MSVPEVEREVERVAECELVVVPPPAQEGRGVVTLAMCCEQTEERGEVRA